MNVQNIDQNHQRIKKSLRLRALRLSFDKQPAVPGRGVHYLQLLLGRFYVVEQEHRLPPVHNGIWWDSAFLTVVRNFRCIAYFYM